MWILLKIRQLHYRNFYYILATTILYLVLDLGYFVQLLILLYFPRPEYYSAVFEIINIFWTVGLMVLIYTLLFRFMQNLSSTALPHWIDTGISNIITFIFTTLFLSTNYVVILENMYPTYDFYSFNYPNDQLIRAVSYTLAVSALIGGLFVLVLIFAIIYYLSVNLQQLQSATVVKQLNRVRLSTMVIAGSSIFSFFTLSDVWYTISVCGYIGIVFFYLRGDILLWTDRHLKTFSIINTVSGLTVYDYNFNIGDANAIPMVSSTLVSSTISSFNAFLNEINRSDQELQQIKLERTTILLKNLVPGFSALLFVDTPSPSLITLFDAFIHSIKDLSPTLPQHTRISSADSKLLDALIHEYFLFY